MSLKEILKKQLTKKQLEKLVKSYDIIGSIAIIEIPKELAKKEKIIADALLNLNKNVRTVLKKGKHTGVYRLQKLRFLAGKKKKETEYKENNVRIRLDVEECYFSPRLATERKRIAEQVKMGEIILAMFSGTGVYPIVIAKNKNPKEVYSIEINPVAIKYQKENILINKINNIKLFKGDVKKIVQKLNKKFDRILMPLPKGAENYLDVALKVAKKNSVIHFYDFLPENEFDKAIKKIDKNCKKLKKKYKILKITKCGQLAPKQYRICVDFKIV